MKPTAFNHADYIALKAENESLQADIAERDEHIDFLHGEMIELVRERFDRTRALAKLEGEIERLRGGE